MRRKISSVQILNFLTRLKVRHTNLSTPWSCYQRYHVEDFPKPPKHIGPIRPDDEETTGSEGSADNYEDSAPKKKRKVRRRHGGDEDEEVAEVGRRRTTQRKRKRKVERTEQDLSNLPKQEGSSFSLGRYLYTLKKGTWASYSGQDPLGHED